MNHDPTHDHPTIDELRAVAQPPEHIARYNAEHWAGALYLRHISIYVTRLLLPTGITANGVTWLMIVIGLLGASAPRASAATGRAPPPRSGREQKESQHQARRHRMRRAR